MAAPMEENETPEDEENEEEINVLSPNFNPLKALYSPKVCLPIADASCFNNIAEYESFMAKSKTAAESGSGARAPTASGEREKSGGNTAGVTAGAAISGSSSAASISTREFEKKHREMLAEKTKELPTSTRFHKKRYQENVLNHMHDAKGPLDLLRQCVEKRCKVRVCVRSFKGLRSVCIGYLIAFDKMLNMALMDVDEIYKRPSTGKRFLHEEKLTYSMILANLNPQKKKEPEPVPPTTPKSQKQDSRKEKKACKFCQIIHETIMEREDAMATTSTSSPTGDSSSSEDDSSSFSSEGGSFSGSDEQAMQRKGRNNAGGLNVAEKRPTWSCPHGRKRVGSGKQPEKDEESEHMQDVSRPDGQRKSSSRASGTELTRKQTTSAVSKATAKPSGVQSVPPPSRLPPSTSDKTESVGVETSATSDTVSSATRSTKALLSAAAVTTAPAKTPAFKKPATPSATSSVKSDHAAPSTKPASGSAVSTTTLTLPAKFSQAMTLNPKPKSDPKSQDGPKAGEEKQAREKVYLDPKSGKRLIQPEEFKRRHVNQLFIRGDNVVLISADSSMVTTDLAREDKQSGS